MALEWVFDSLVEFLRGPIWNIPVLTFIEQKSVVFEPGAEKEQELRKIHEAYKNLVDFMLGSYMEDLNITPEEFERSCSVASKKALNKFQQSLFQQVWAADDFEIFRRMMTQKNLELQLQALEFLTQKRGSVPHCMEGTRQAEDPSDAILQVRMSVEAQREKELLEQAMQKTLLQPETSVQTEKEKTGDSPPAEDKQEEARTLPADDIREPSPCADTESLTVQPPPDVCSLPIPNVPEKETPDDETQTNTPSQVPEVIPEQPTDEYLPKQLTVQPPLDVCSLPIPDVPEKETPEDETQTNTPSQVPEVIPEQTADEYVTKQEVSPAELQKRQEYLRQQRDRLLALKKQERARRLSEDGAEEASAQQRRPRSARAARKVLEAEAPPEAEATFRRSLAAKLRSEVIGESQTIKLFLK
ncbi:cilia- and flagella-associated protein 36-like [Uloborus diversus]|uniref:cilia- and flagella-associated protein 36-like n=1 Tax=Uloborus diversus TaxID=327109 RepID=UPI00240969F8|nr:cilia- and flagella-associated protein 36-like [Uloborus diversus]